MVVAATITFLAAAMAVPFAMDWVGLAIVPAVTLACSAAAAAAASIAVARTAAGSGSTNGRSSSTSEPPDAAHYGPVRRGLVLSRDETLGFGAVALSTFAWLVWIAWPSLLPQGRGPDLAHHLLLVDYIDQHWRLPHDPALGPALGEMLHYTPGLHLLASNAGAWFRSDGLHAIYPLVAFTVAVKAGLVFLIAMRLLPGGRERRVTSRDAALARGFLLRVTGALDPLLPIAATAPLLLFVPREYFLRSFLDASFLAQVVSECFAVAMWWAIVVWNERPSRTAAALFAVAGIGVFLAWPVWLGPLVIVFAASVAFHRDPESRSTVAARADPTERAASAHVSAASPAARTPAADSSAMAPTSGCALPTSARVLMLATALAPIAVVAAMYAASHAAAARIITVSGYVPPLRVELFGAWFLVLAAVGLVLAALARSARSVVWLAAAIVVQSIVLAILARSRGTARPYQALKMMYLLVYPLAVAAMLATARAVAACVAAVALRVKTTAEHVHERDDIMAMSKQPAMEATNERAAALTATGVLRGADGFDRGTMLAAWAVTLAVGAAAVGPVLRSPGARPVVTEALFEAGVWARDHVPRGCVDYLVADDYSAYWLHVAVLRNGRSANGPLGEDLFEAKKSVVRWIVPEGLPYAIAEHFDALPKDIRDNVDVLARFGEAAVIRRRGASTCSGQ